MWTYFLTVAIIRIWKFSFSNLLSHYHSAHLWVLNCCHISVFYLPYCRWTEIHKFGVLRVHVLFYHLASFVKWRSLEGWRSRTDTWVSGSIPYALGDFSSTRDQKRLHRQLSAASTDNDYELPSDVIVPGLTTNFFIIFYFIFLFIYFFVWLSTLNFDIYICYCYLLFIFVFIFDIYIYICWYARCAHFVLFHDECII
jgi:hypothetical protein